MSNLCNCCSEYVTQGKSLSFLFETRDQYKSNSEIQVDNVDTPFSIEEHGINLSNVLKDLQEDELTVSELWSRIYSEFKC